MQELFKKMNLFIVQFYIYTDFFDLFLRINFRSDEEDDDAEVIMNYHVA